MMLEHEQRSTRSPETPGGKGTECLAPRGASLTRGTVVFGSIYPWGSQLRFAAILRKRGFRVERVSASGDTTRDKVRSSVERLVYHRVERSLGTRLPPVVAASRRVGTGVGCWTLLDLQLDDWVAAALTERTPRSSALSAPHSGAVPRTGPVRQAGHGPACRGIRMADTRSSSPPPTSRETGHASSNPGSAAAAKASKWWPTPTAVAERWTNSVDGLEVIVQEFVTGESVRVGGIARDGKLRPRRDLPNRQSPKRPVRPECRCRGHPHS